MKHFLEHGLVEVADDNWQPADPGRVIECLSAIISAGAEPGMGRPRVAELVRSAGFHHSNEALGKALKLFNGGWKLGESMDPYLA